MSKKSNPKNIISPILEACINGDYEFLLEQIRQGKNLEKEVKKITEDKNLRSEIRNQSVLKILEDSGLEVDFFEKNYMNFRNIDTLNEDKGFIGSIKRIGVGLSKIVAGASVGLAVGGLAVMGLIAVAAFSGMGIVVFMFPAVEQAALSACLGLIAITTAIGSVFNPGILDLGIGLAPKPLLEIITRPEDQIGYKLQQAKEVGAKAKSAEARVLESEKLSPAIPTQVMQQAQETGARTTVEEVRGQEAARVSPAIPTQVMRQAQETDARTTVEEVRGQEAARVSPAIPTQVMRQAQETDARTTVEEVRGQEAARRVSPAIPTQVMRQAQETGARTTVEEVRGQEAARVSPAIPTQVMRQAQETGARMTVEEVRGQEAARVSPAIPTQVMQQAQEAGVGLVKKGVNKIAPESIISKSPVEKVKQESKENSVRHS